MSKCVIYLAKNSSHIKSVYLGQLDIIIEMFDHFIIYNNINITSINFIHLLILHVFM